MITFTETFLPKVDGIVNTLCYLLRHLAERGHESVLFAPPSPVKRYAQTRIVTFGGWPFALHPDWMACWPTMNG